MLGALETFRDLTKLGALGLVFIKGVAGTLGMWFVTILGSTNVLVMIEFNFIIDNFRR